MLVRIMKIMIVAYCKVLSGTYLRDHGKLQTTPLAMLSVVCLLIGNIYIYEHLLVDIISLKNKSPSKISQEKTLISYSYFGDTNFEISYRNRLLWKDCRRVLQENSEITPLNLPGTFPFTSFQIQYSDYPKIRRFTF
jgi:hypothetical protein